MPGPPAAAAAWSEKFSSGVLGEYSSTFKSVQRRLRFHIKTIALAGVSLLVLTSFLAYRRGSSSSSSGTSAASRYFGPSTHWHGWNEIEYLFAFGDSWSSNNFAHDGVQPSPRNPIGNPAFPGDASCNGPNWVAWLTATYNNTFIKAYDLAHGAATIDREVIPPLFTQSVTLREQVDSIFLPYYGASPQYAPWLPRNTLVAIWSGIVDAELFVRNQNLTSLVPTLVDSYFAAVDRLYTAGIRNFLLLRLPPMFRAPDSEDRILSQAFLKTFHESMLRSQKNFTQVYKDSTVMLFDTYAAFNAFLDHPRDFSALDRVANFTDWCQDYNDMLGVIVDAPDSFKPECGVSIDRYFWINAIHPGFAVHNATSAAIIDHCMRMPRGEWCVA